MLKRVAITIAVWGIGLALLTTNGQHFTHGLTVLLAAVLGALPWVSRLRRREHSVRQRFAAFAIVAASAVIAVQVSLHLPRAYDEQQRFNART